MGEGKLWLPHWVLICSWSEIPWPEGKFLFGLTSWAINCSNVEDGTFFYCHTHTFSPCLAVLSEPLSLVS